VGALALVASAARGQTTPEPVTAFDAERLLVNPGARGSLILWTGDGLPKGSIRGAMVGQAQRDPFVAYLDEMRVGAILRWRWSLHLSLAYAPTERLELSIVMPIVVHQWGDEIEGVAPVSTSGRGTPHIAMRFLAAGERLGEPLDLSIDLAVGPPFSSERALTGDDGWQLLPRLGLGKNLSDYVRGGAELGVWLRPKATLSGPAGRDQMGSLFLLGGMFSTVTEPLRVELGARGFIAVTKQPSTAELWGGLRVELARLFELFAVVGTGFGRAPGTPALRVLAGVGVGDEAAPEPPEPPPLPPPPPPCVPGRPHRAEVCPELDADGDGVKNRVDRCPYVPEDIDQFEDADGCPDADDDRDGVPDVRDKCPRVPGDPRWDGCPPPDRDRDGVLDHEDRCPDEPGPPARQGCPVRDRDGDGVEDAQDSCIDEPGPPENKGCPRKPLVEITKEKLVIYDKVYFDFNKADIKSQSFPLLDQVARVLGEHPEIKHIIVEGHTDNRGRPEYNRQLSQRRAEAVREFLVGRGVAPDRLSAKGFGPDKPTQSNATSWGREANRRVEFIIADTPGTPPP
jgi:outer membrane protein OmpA-like peptidoglycan-associated protein